MGGGRGRGSQSIECGEGEAGAAGQLSVGRERQGGWGDSCSSEWGGGGGQGGEQKGGSVERSRRWGNGEGWGGLP